MYNAGGGSATVMTKALLLEKRQEIRRIAARFGAGNVRVFGSVARGDERDDSDVDLLVTFEPGRSLVDHAGLVMALEELLGKRVEVASDKALRERVRARVLNEALPL